MTALHAVRLAIIEFLSAMESKFFYYYVIYDLDKAKASTTYLAMSSNLYICYASLAIVRSSYFFYINQLNWLIR